MKNEKGVSCMIDEERNQYQFVCKPNFDRIESGLEELKNRFFHDNGKDSIQTSIIKTSAFLKEIKDWQDQHSKKEATNPIQWLSQNWRTFSAVIFVIIWLLTNVFNVKSFSTEQRSEIKEMLKTIIVDTRE